MSPRFRHRGPKRFFVITPWYNMRGTSIIGRYRTREAAEQAIKDFWKHPYWREFEMHIVERNDQ